MDDLGRATFTGQRCPYCHGPLPVVSEEVEHLPHICPLCGAVARFVVTKLYTAVGERPGDAPPPPDLRDCRGRGEAAEVIRVWERRHRRVYGGDRRYPFNRHHVYGDGLLDPEWERKAAKR